MFCCRDGEELVNMLMQDTLPKLLLHNYEKWGDKKVAMRKKDFGIWNEYTWKDVYENVKYFCLGLLDLGLKKGDKSTIIGDNDPHWTFAQLAVQAAGGVSVGAFQDSISAELKYIIDHSDSVFVIVEDQEQVDKILEVKDELPAVKKVIYWDPKGLWSYEEGLLASFEDVVQLGRDYEKLHPGLFEETVNQGRGDDVLMIAYTSGTTGVSKGVVITHKALIIFGEQWNQVLPALKNEQVFAAAPLAWNAEQANSTLRLLYVGAMVNYPEEPDTAQENFREISPTTTLLGLRQLQEMLATIQVKMAKAKLIQRLIYSLFIPVGYKKANFEFEHKCLPFFWKGLYAIGDFLIFKGLRDNLGLVKSKRVLTGGAMMGEDLYTFFHAIGVSLRTMFGTTELACHPTVHRDGDVKRETCGLPVPGIELRISDESELMVKSPTLMVGYYKNPDATAKVLLPDGYLATGDAALIDEDGHLVVIDRMQDVARLDSGTRYAPLYIETKLQFSPYIKDAVVIGEGKSYLAVLISMNYETVGRWAEDKKIAYTTFADLSQRKEVYDLIEKDIRRVNRSLPEATKLRTFALLHKQLDADDAELTRTRKLRRGFIMERYRALCEALHKEQSEFVAKVRVRYRDGRETDIQTAVNISFISGD